MNIMLTTDNGYNLIPDNTFLLEKRKIFLEGEITNEKALELAKTLMIMKAKDLPIQLFINSPGGSIDAGFMILDMLLSYPGEIETYCLGRAYSMAAIIFILSKKRHIFPSSKVMLHEPLVSNLATSSTSEIKEMSEMLESYKGKLIDLLAKRTGKSKKFFEKELKQDRYYTAEECLEFNYADTLTTLADIKEVDIWNMM